MELIGGQKIFRAIHIEVMMEDYINIDPKWFQNDSLGPYLFIKSISWYALPSIQEQII